MSIVLMITKNSEKTIDKCLSRIVGYDKIIVLDSFSKDKTLSMLTDMNNLTLFQADLDISDSWSVLFNYVKENYPDEMCFKLDSDEYLDKNLNMLFERIDGYRHGKCYFRTFIINEYCNYPKNYNLRFFIPSKTTYSYRSVHEAFLPDPDYSTNILNLGCVGNHDRDTKLEDLVKENLLRGKLELNEKHNFGIYGIIKDITRRILYSHIYNGGYKMGKKGLYILLGKILYIIMYNMAKIENDTKEKVLK